jgi:outer membrane protein assembly factor BamE
MLYYQPLKIKSYKMRLIFIIFIFLMMPACSWLDSNPSDEDNIPVGQEDDDTDISVIPLINIITKFLPETYRQDISQGNEITPEMLLEIKPDMNKSQVRFVLGTPLIQDSFHKNRWDYIYVVRQKGKFIESRHLILTFKKDKLVNLTGDLIDRNKDVKNMEFQNAKEWDEESLAEEQKKFGDIEDKKETLEKSNGSIDNEQIQSVEEPVKGKAVEESGSVSQSVKEPVKKNAVEESGSVSQSANEPVKKNAVEESGSVSQSVKEDLNTSLPDKEDPGYFELLMENIGF